VRNQLLVRAGYGLTDQLEGFIKMGGTSSAISDVFVSGGGWTVPGNYDYNQDMEGNMEFTIVGGLAYTILQQGDFRLGTVGQFTYFETDDTGEAYVYPGITINQGIDASVFRFEGALLASYTLGKFTPYGGICMLITDSDARYRAYTPTTTPLALLDIDLDQEDWFGGVCGVNCAVTDNVRVGLELTGVSEGVGLSTGVTIAL
jgi:opacity protein-like surface antigen